MTARAALLGIALLASACAGRAEPAKPDGPVVDAADILPPETEKALDTKLRRYWLEKETAIVVASLPSLEGETVDTAASRLFRDWGIGSAKTHRGLLVLIAPDDRKARIEVGCGLETVVTDVAAQQVIDDDMLPRLRAAQYGEAASAAVDALIERIDTAKVAAGPVSPVCVQIMKDAA